MNQRCNRWHFLALSLVYLHIKSHCAQVWFYTNRLGCYTMQSNTSIWPTAILSVCPCSCLLVCPSRVLAWPQNWRVKMDCVAKFGESTFVLSETVVTLILKANLHFHHHICIFVTDMCSITDKISRWDIAYIWKIDVVQESTFCCKFGTGSANFLGQKHNFKVPRVNFLFQS